MPFAVRCVLVGFSSEFARGALTASHTLPYCHIVPVWDPQRRRDAVCGAGCSRRVFVGVCTPCVDGIAYANLVSSCSRVESAEAARCRLRYGVFSSGFRRGLHAVR